MTTVIGAATPAEQTITIEETPSAAQARKYGKKKDVLLLDPRHIVVDHAQNGRAYPHSHDAVMRLVSQFTDPNEGQETPVGVRVVNGKYNLVYGFRRTMAALYIVNHIDPEFKIAALPKTLNDREAFLRNLRENTEHEATTPIDQAVNIRRMSEQFGMTHAEIGEWYGITVPWVGQLLKLLTLPDDIRLLVHNGELPASAAVTLVDQPTEEARKIIEANRTEGGKVKGSGVKAAVRERNQQTGDGKTIAISMRELRGFFQSIIDESTDEEGNLVVPESKVRFAKDMLAVLKGKLTLKGAANAIERLATAGDWPKR